MQAPAAAPMMSPVEQEAPVEWIQKWVNKSLVPSLEAQKNQQLFLSHLQPADTPVEGDFKQHNEELHIFKYQK